MNIFLPQSIQTQIELEKITDVTKQIINPGSSRTIIGIVQDGLIGSYNMTSPAMKIDWRSTMNIVSYTSIDDFSSFKKNKEYTGDEVFSLIIPSKINISKGSVKIENGNITQGTLDKSLLGAKQKGAIHQLIWDEYGSADTLDRHPNNIIIDNTNFFIFLFPFCNSISQ